MNAEKTDMKHETAKKPYPVEAQQGVSFSDYNDLH
jgi:hypothetical protein